MNQNHKDDRHSKQMKVRGLCQLAKGHWFSEGRIGTPVMLGQPFGSQLGHAMSPKEGKKESYEHQQEKPGID